MHIRRLKSFTKSFDKLGYSLQNKVFLSLELFMLSPVHERLYNHALKGKRSGYRSINVTGDARIIFRELRGGTYELVELVNVGTRSQLYG